MSGYAHLPIIRTTSKHSISVHLWLVLSRLYPFTNFPNSLIGIFHVINKYVLYPPPLGWLAIQIQAAIAFLIVLRVDYQSEDSCAHRKSPTTRIWVLCNHIPPPSQLRWLLNLERLLGFKHILQPSKHMPSFGIHSWSHIKPHTTRILVSKNNRVRLVYLIIGQGAFTQNHLFGGWWCFWFYFQRITREKVNDWKSQPQSFLLA